jgi:hypothetical protein
MMQEDNHEWSVKNDLEAIMASLKEQPPNSSEILRKRVILYSAYFFKYVLCCFADVIGLYVYYCRSKSVISHHTARSQNFFLYFVN